MILLARMVWIFVALVFLISNDQLSDDAVRCTVSAFGFMCLDLLRLFLGGGRAQRLQSCRGSSVLLRPKTPSPLLSVTLRKLQGHNVMYPSHQRKQARWIPVSHYRNSSTAGCAMTSELKQISQQSASSVLGSIEVFLICLKV